MAKGIEERHTRSCRATKGGRCDCEPTYRVRIRLQGREPVRRTFQSQAEAKSWRRDALIAARRGRDVELGGRQTLRRVAEDWIKGARAGTIRTRSGDRYKPAAIQTCRTSSMRRSALAWPRARSRRRSSRCGRSSGANSSATGSQSTRSPASRSLGDAHAGRESPTPRKQPL
jgi:hypothetical protein